MKVDHFSYFKNRKNSDIFYFLTLEFQKIEQTSLPHNASLQL